MRQGWHRLLFNQLILLGILILLLYGLNLGLSELRVPHTSLVVALVTLLAGLWLIARVARLLPRYLEPNLGPNHITTIRFLFQLLAYLALAFAVFSILKVNVASLLVGGAFAGLLLGLVSQTVFSNLLAGILIVFARPVEVGDRITLVTWQFGQLAPAYPPKFYSSDLVLPGYTGVVQDVSFLYVSLLTDEHRFFKLPSGIFMQALIVNHSRSEHIVVRIKYEVEKTLDPRHVLPAVEAALSQSPWLYPGATPTVLIQEMTLNTYILLAQVPVQGFLEEPPKSELLQRIFYTVQQLRESSR